jgi:hypothetical protein
VALTTDTYAQQLGRVYAKAIKDEPLIEELWLTTWQDGVHLWLITPQIDMQDERRLHAYTRVLYDTFKKADFTVHVMNPLHFRGEIRDALPKDAAQFPLRQS